MKNLKKVYLLTLIAALIITGCTIGDEEQSLEKDIFNETESSVNQKTDQPKAIIEPTIQPSPSPTFPHNWVHLSPMSTARYGHAAGVVGQIIYVIGGVGGPGEVEAYDPNTDSWTVKEDLPIPIDHPSTCIIDEKIYAIGGIKDLQGSQKTIVEAYDPKTDSWETLSYMPVPRTLITAVAHNGKIYVIGGISDEFQVVGNVDVYDPRTDDWTSITEMPTARYFLSAVVINNKIYTIGGILSLGGTSTPAVEVYDLETGTWEEKSAMPSARSFGSLVYINEKIYLFGGISAGGGISHPTLFSYDIDSDKWQKLDDMPFGRQGMTASVVDEKIFIIGGSGTRYPHKPYLNEVIEFIPIQDN